MSDAYIPLKHLTEADLAERRVIWARIVADQAARRMEADDLIRARIRADQRPGQ